MANNKKLIIIKISGASLKSEKDIIDIDFLNELARQIKEIYKSFRVAIVLGGGNIWRGNIASEIKMERYKADQMGMLATVMNSLALQSALKNVNIKANIFSTIEMEKIADNYVIRHLNDSLERDEVAILSCGTGRPYFTTDTGIAVSAAELQASYILMGKNNVDGVYDSDPNKNPNAKFFKHLTYSKAINDELKVMDSTAAAICKLTNIKTIVFKINEPNGIVNALNLKSRFTLISEDENDYDNLDFLISQDSKTDNNINLNNDYTDEEVEKFLEEEAPIFSKMTDEDILAVEKFLSQGQLNNSNNTESNIENTTVEKDFATEFFTWEKQENKTTSSENNFDGKNLDDLFQDQTTELHANTIEPTIEPLSFDNQETEINEDESIGSLLDRLNENSEETLLMGQMEEQFEQQGSIYENDVLDSENEATANLDEFVQNIEDSAYDVNNIINKVDDELTSQESYNQSESLNLNLDLDNKEAMDDFITNINFYIEEVENIKNNIIKENIEKTDEIKRQIEKKDFE